MFSSNNYYKHTEIDSTEAATPEHYLIPNLNFGGIKFESVPEDEIAEDPENVLYMQKKEGEIISNARADAKRIIASAESMAQAILQKARNDADKQAAEKYNSAMENGYKEGLVRGKETAREENKEVIKELQAISDRLSQEMQEIFESSQSLILDLASVMARKAAGESFVKDENVFLSMFRRAVKDLPAAQKLRVTIAECDYELMSFDPEKLIELAEGFSSIEICCDKTAEAGTLKVETAVMLLDASINTQVSVMKKEIAKTF